MLSPSKDNTLLDNRYAIVSFEESPLSLVGCSSNPFAIYSNEICYGEKYITTADDTLREVKYYSLMTKYTPVGLQFVSRTPFAKDSRTLRSLYPNSINHSIVTLPADSQPEIFTSVARGSCEIPFVGEGKSFGSNETLYSELATYGLGALVESFFSSDDPRRRMRFYESPPVAFGIANAAYLGHIMLIEWVGQLRISPWSEPFFLATDLHNDSIRRLDSLKESAQFQERYNRFHDIDFEHASWSNDQRNNISWTRIDKVFWKVISGPRDEQGQFYKSLFQVYEKYTSIFREPLLEIPTQLVAARLLFGQFAVAVRMEEVGIRDATDKEMIEPRIATQVAKAMAYLAYHGLLYIDLRSPNVRIGADDEIYLVDYDDMLVIAPCTSFQEWKSLVQERHCWFANDDCCYMGAVSSAFIQLTGNAD